MLDMNFFGLAPGAGEPVDSLFDLAATQRAARIHERTTRLR
jgi:hypothetical protein